MLLAELSGEVYNENNEWDDVDPFCWMVYTQHFISQDQLINLFYGFAFIKKYIPAEATVTTCNGDIYKPLEMMHRMSEAIVTKINDHGDHITLPGSKDCCNKEVKLSECEGGNLRLTLYGLLKAAEYIQGKDTRTTLAQQIRFEGMANFKSGRSFFFKESCMFKDLSTVSNFNQAKMAAIAEDKHKEILMLGNDLLFPDGESVADMVGGEEFFKQLLCDTPCSGPCHADRDYSAEWPGTSGRWPEGFHCANTPGWEGNRWDGEGAGVENGETGPVRRSNGLDYMALFNMYMLKYGSGDFYNPHSIQKSNNLVAFNYISGPDVLCTEVTGHYEIKDYNSDLILENIKWSSTPNLTLSSPAQPQTEVSFNTNRRCQVQ
jgi:hypothetical protein